MGPYLKNVKCVSPGRREARNLGIYPYFHALESRQDTVVQMEGKRRIMLAPTIIWV